MGRQRAFVADAAHELRTPVAIMRAAAEMAMADGTLPEALVALEQTWAQSSHLTRLVEDLSLLARADSGTLRLLQGAVDLAALAAETAGEVGILAEDRGSRVLLDVRGEVLVLGDASRLRQVLIILLDNAVRHTPRGGIITVSVARAGGQVCLAVRDTGPGIRPGDLPHVFERFYRADQARGGEGTGLGLSIAREIAVAHGGRLTAANASEGGAIFTLIVPLHERRTAV
jgi:signal transduction histidine kinase